MKTALLAEHALMNVLLKQYQKEISIKSTRIFALIVVHVLMYARLRLYILSNIAFRRVEGLPESGSPSVFHSLPFTADYILPSQEYPVYPFHS